MSAIRPGWAFLAGLGAGCVLLATIFWVLQPGPDRDAAVLLTRADSLRATRAGFETQINTAARHETVYVRQVVRMQARADTVIEHADSIGRSADSLAAIATRLDLVRDSASVADSAATSWRLAYVARTAGFDSLRVALGFDHQALDAARLALAESDRQVRLALTRDSIAESVAAALAQSLKSATDCRVLWVIRCPTRKEAFVAGAVVTLGGVLAAKRRRQ